MPKVLPYFRWYPADAETDTIYSSMTDAELGFYHRCLNWAWINGGIPADPAARAKALRHRVDTANKLWKTVGKCFVTCQLDSRFLVNPRQEMEREVASRKSQLAMESAKVGSERRANAQTRAYDSVSVSGSEGVEGGSGGKPDSGEACAEPPKVTVLRPPRWKNDVDFVRFAKAYMNTGAAMIEEDFNMAYDICWKKLDYIQRTERLNALDDHAQEYTADPRFVPKPLKFLQVEWQRPVKPIAINGKGQLPRGVLAEALKEMHAGRAKR